MSRSLIAASIVLHAALAAGLLSIRPPERHELVRITVRELNDDPPPPPVEAPEPPPPAPEPEVAEAAPVPAVPPPRAPRAPEPAVAEAAPAPAEAAPVADVPDFGIALSGSASGPGIAVPTGDPGGAVRPPGERRVRESRRALEPAAHVEEASDGCAEEATRPRALSMPPPRYTDAARAAGLEGRVRVEIHVDASGNVTDVRVLSSLDPDLDAAALEAARNASFAPATRCGVAVEATFTVSIRFEL